uniref:CHK domain-containing protein n=1 Tax=Anopheles dirus TaxID=7168 RepID=A0A182N4H5_9DIPT
MTHDISWKNKSFFMDVIARDLGLESSDSITITSFNVEKANEKTAGYMSFIHRVSIEVEHSGIGQPPISLSYIVKEKTYQAFGGDLVDILAVFPKEIEVYEKLLPAFERLFSEGESVRFGPKMLKTISTPFTVLVMEDLNRSQFTMREKSFGLPMSDVDFQTACYGSFAVDILYFFITSATELICDSFEELLQFYHANLVSALQQLRYQRPIPSYNDLLLQMKRRGVLMLPPLSEAVAITMAGLTEPSQLEMITSDQPEGVELRTLVYSTPSFVALTDRLIPKLFELESAVERNNIMTHDISWKTKSFFMDVIARDLGLTSSDSFTITSFNVAKANEKTAGYMSFIHRVSIEVEHSGMGQSPISLSYIVKEKTYQAFGGDLVDILALRYQKPIPSYNDLLLQMKRRGVLMLPPLSEAVAITMAGLTESSQMEMITSDQPEGVELRTLAYGNPSYVSLVDRLIPRMFELGLLG